MGDFGKKIDDEVESFLDDTTEEPEGDDGEVDTSKEVNNEDKSSQLDETNEDENKDVEDITEEIMEESDTGGLPTEEENDEEVEEPDEGWKLPGIDPSNLYDYAVDKTPELSTKLYNKFDSLWEYFKDNSIASMKGRIAYEAMRTVLKNEFKKVNKVQLWTIMKTGELPDEIWEREGETRFPKGTVRDFKKLNKVVDVEDFLIRLDKMLAEQGGELIMLVIKDVRPDVFRIIKQNHGEWMAWQQARRLRQDIRYLIEEIRRG